MYSCADVSLHTRLCVSLHTRLCVHVSLHTRLCVSLHTRLCVSLHTRLCVSLHTRLCVSLQSRAVVKQLNHNTTTRSKLSQDLDTARETIQHLQVSSHRMTLYMYMYIPHGRLLLSICELDSMLACNQALNQCKGKKGSVFFCAHEKGPRFDANSMHADINKL